ncbi:hypothetical protein NP233_g3286 [Leucocoprinus birnbaumii]|uniref:Uncharacterized protein n=1 Tax=Leucocoprinus birnbaumii TaxID=56174 RepID=A0AAD5VZE2_9AGAR|nr:hypothetical protein NP233_g3286 [Leucocoprinus birnbaumii]
MFTKSSFSILSLATLAIAQTIQVCNVINDPEEPHCIRMDTFIPLSGDPAVWFPPSLWYAQQWIFTREGYLINAYSGYALEAPLNGDHNLSGRVCAATDRSGILIATGGIVTGRGLTLKTPDAKAPNQQWKVDDKSRIVPVLNESLAISGRNHTIIPAYTPVELYPTNDSDTTQVFTFIDMKYQQFGSFLNCSNILGGSCSQTS